MTDKSYPPPCRNYLKPFYLSVTLYACAQREEVISELIAFYFTNFHKLKVNYGNMNWVDTFFFCSVYFASPKHRLQGIILDISSNRLFKAVRVYVITRTQKNRPFLKIKFANKIIDAMNLSIILK